MIKKILLSAFSCIMLFGVEQNEYIVHIVDGDSLAWVLPKREVSLDSISFRNRGGTVCPGCRMQDKANFNNRALYFMYEVRGDRWYAGPRPGDQASLLKFLMMYAESGAHVFYNTSRAETGNFNPSCLLECSIKGNFACNRSPQLPQSGAFKISSISYYPMPEPYIPPHPRTMTAVLLIFSYGRDEVDPEFASKIEKSLVPVVGEGNKNPCKVP